MTVLLVKLACIYCGEHMHPERAAMGRRFCTAKPCAKRGFVPRTIVAMALPKSTFLVQGFQDDDPTLGLKEGQGARRYR